MPDTKPPTERVKLRHETRAAAEQTDKSFPSEGIAPLPLEVGIHFGANAVKQLMETGLDAARFYNGRLAKDVGLLSEFSLCRTPADVVELWSRAVSEAAHDYADQFDRALAINLNGLGALTNGAGK